MEPSQENEGSKSPEAEVECEMSVQFLTYYFRKFKI